jgi:hypothetical protein
MTAFYLTQVLLARYARNQNYPAPQAGQEESDEKN